MLNKPPSDFSKLGKLVHNQLGELICLHSLRGDIRYVSPSSEKILGYSPSELAGRELREFIHPDDYIQLNIFTENTVSQAVPLELRVLAQWGDYVLLQTFAHSFQDESTGELMWYSSSRDISTLKKAQPELDKMMKDLGAMSAGLGRQHQQLLDFSYIISHNLRGPVSNVITLANFLQEADNEEEKSMIIESINESSRQLNSVFEELMEVLKVRNFDSLRMESIRLGPVVKAATKLFEASVHKEGGEISIDIPDHIRVRSSYEYLKSILANLFSNALKFRDTQKDKLRIDIRYSVNELGEKKLCFTDNGLGIDMKKYQDKVFKLHQTFHRHPQARGFGLFMSKNQMEAMGGEIRLHSEVGKGCTFSLIFNPVIKPFKVQMPEFF